MTINRLLRATGFAALMILGATHISNSQNESTRIQITTGAYITPTAAPGSSYRLLTAPLPGYPNYVVDHAESSAVSPDGTTMLVLTSGYNLNFAADTNDANDHVDHANSGEFVFVFDISSGKAVQKQVLMIPNGYSGIVWAPSGKQFYVAGGQDDNVHVFAQNTAGQWIERVSTVAPVAPVALGHPNDNSGDGPVAAGLGITQDGKTLIVANYMNDSISVVDLTSGKVTADLDLRPGKNNPADSGKPGGEFPFWVAVKGNSTAYVSSARDREIVVVNIAASSPSILGRIHVNGNPNKMTLNRAQTRLYATVDNEDALYVIDTRSKTHLLTPWWRSRRPARHDSRVFVTLGSCEWRGCAWI